MRAASWVFIAMIVGCRPSATVVKTMPVANLQAYRTVALRVQATAFASQGQAMVLEARVAERLRQHCAFELVRPGSAVDFMLDLNIVGSGRGGGRWVSNSSKATIDTLLVLSDGQSGDPLGTARIRGESSGMILNNGSPENEALEVIAKTIVEILAKSGCSGPRVARAPEPTTGSGPVAGQGSGTAPVDGAGSNAGSGAGSATPPPVDDEKRAQAESLNESGKMKLRSADVAGALTAFQQANALVPDPRYQFNVCLAFEASERFADATAACRQARTMNPDAKLLTKIDRRLELLAQHK